MSSRTKIDLPAPGAMKPSSPALRLVPAPTATIARRTLQHSHRRGLMITLALMHGVVLIAWPILPVFALGLWWNANTVSHNFIHRPFFKSSWLNRLFSLYLTALLGFPQSVWRDRHLAHHADKSWQLRINSSVAVEIALVGALWSLMLIVHPAFFATIYLPGYAMGIGLCFLQGYYEHNRGATSHYGKVYNFLFLNDGYHVEHHFWPAVAWAQLPGQCVHGATSSRWPAVLRWLDVVNLVTLEKLALRSKILQRFLIETHRRAFRKLLPTVGPVRSVGIVGGGIFPRTALILRELLPETRLVVIDADIESIRLAQRFSLRDVEFINEWYDPARHTAFDLLVVPLSLVGDRSLFHQRPMLPHVIVHEWIWNRQERSAIVSIFLLKRLNLISGRKPESAGILPA